MHPCVSDVTLFSLGRCFPKQDRACECLRLCCSLRGAPQDSDSCLASCLFIGNVIYQFHIYQKVSALNINIWVLEEQMSPTLNEHTGILIWGKNKASLWFG